MEIEVPWRLVEALAYACRGWNDTRSNKIRDRIFVSYRSGFIELSATNGVSAVRIDKKLTPEQEAGECTPFSIFLEPSDTYRDGLCTKIGFDPTDRNMYISGQQVRLGSEDLHTSTGVACLDPNAESPRNFSEAINGILDPLSAEVGAVHSDFTSLLHDFIGNYALVSQYGRHTMFWGTNFDKGLEAANVVVFETWNDEEVRAWYDKRYFKALVIPPFPDAAFTYMHQINPSRPNSEGIRHDVMGFGGTCDVTDWSWCTAIASMIPSKTNEQLETKAKAKITRAHTRREEQLNGEE